MVNALPEGFILKEKVAALAETLLANHPGMPNLLAEIYKTVKQYPEQVTLLSEPEILSIVNGLEKQTNVFLVDSLAKKDTATKTSMKKLKELGADAF